MTNICHLRVRKHLKSPIDLLIIIMIIIIITIIIIHANC